MGGRKGSTEPCFQVFKKFRLSQNYLKILMQTAFFKVGCILNEEPTKGLALIGAVIFVEQEMKILETHCMIS